MSRPKVPGYVLGEKIGSGTFADVYKAYLKDNPKEVFAVKCIRKGNLSASLADSIVTEISLLKQLKHPYIVQLKDFIWDELYIFVVMEYCSGGDLSSFIRSRQRLPESVCRRFLQQLALALEYLRSHNVAHMDLKPQNLLLSSRSNPILKLADFGLAKSFGNQETETTLRGSPLYMAPEILLQKSYGATVDLWSVGVILYECLFGQAPYSSKSLAELVNKIKTGAPIKIPTDVQISQECHDLLSKLLKRNSEERITFEDFFAHPFLKSSPLGQNQEKKASDVVIKAEEQRAKGNILAALRSYCDASQLYNQLIQCETSEAKKAQLRLAMNQCVRCSEELKAVLKNSSQGKLPVTSSDTTQELMQLLGSTPSLKTAFEIGLAAVQYDGEGQYAAALERYEMALEQLLLLLRHEPKGRRKELLLQQVSMWMSRAESIKEMLEQNQIPAAVPAALLESRCTIQ